MEFSGEHISNQEPSGALLLAYLQRKATASEKAVVEQWINASPENELVMIQVAKIFYEQRKHDRMAARDPEVAFEKVRKRIKGKTRRLWIQRVAVVAACFAGVWIVSTLQNRFRPVTSGVAQLITIEANPGMRMHVNLPDGTVAFLNSGSTLTYPVAFDKKERKVSLNGEAYFKVAHNPKHPFVVGVSNDRMKLTVLGTEFNLQAYAEENLVQTTLVTGKVQLKFLDNRGLGKEKVLMPSEKATYDLVNGTINVKEVNTDFDTAWMEGRLVFKDTPLPEVLRRLSHFYSVRFEVKDPVIRSYCFTGTFENKQLFQILDYLKISSDIDYKIFQTTKDDSDGPKYTKVVLKMK